MIYSKAKGTINTKGGLKDVSNDLENKLLHLSTPSKVKEKNKIKLRSNLKSVINKRESYSKVKTLETDVQVDSHQGLYVQRSENLKTLGALSWHIKF